MREDIAMLLDEGSDQSNLEFLYFHLLMSLGKYPFSDHRKASALEEVYMYCSTVLQTNAFRRSQKYVE